ARILLNIVAGHSPKEQRYYGDFLDHDQRYARTEDFLAVCHRFWRHQVPVDHQGPFYQIEGGILNTEFNAQAQQHPSLFIAGGSDPCRDLAVSQGDIWMRLADTPEAVGRAARPVLAAGKQLGLRLAVMVRPTRAEALDAARALIGDLNPNDSEAAMEKKFIGNSDSVSMKTTYALAEEEWLTHTLWTGAIRTHGAPAACLVGTPDEVAGALMDYKRHGVTHFILSGWPKQAEMVIFGNEVIPRVRALEAKQTDETARTAVSA
ncbi:MAG: LLM class flavin-dependent oxidoreductase, partial [Algicola sp.]|nr:LLM class flavin-dependent oxidoreductase [Algicola sp.]